MKAIRRFVLIGRISTGFLRSAWWPGLGVWLILQATAAVASTPPELVIPRLTRAPVLEDFLRMEPSADLKGRMAKVEGFVQREPSDGRGATERTEVYIGYDDDNLYIVFVAFDSEPAHVRARMSRRENISNDDMVEVMLDTFNDRRRAFVFTANPLGIQRDALWTEGDGFNTSFDTLWHSEGRLTDRGYVVRMAIPLKSLRFSSEAKQTWSIILRRAIPRYNEEDYWPRVSNRVEGLLNQAATLAGLEDISPGRNIQLIPYGVYRAFRALDLSAAGGPAFVRDRADVDAGLDAKIVLKDSLALDVTVNPDFSQVESDEPQVTVNRRFEVFFPEKRPFFLENANLFSTPLDNLVFTRRIADPQFGARLTGKVGSYAIGAFLIDDESPGKSAPPGDPLHGKRALFGVARVTRDIFEQSSISALYTIRRFEGSSNQVSGLDGRFKLNSNWAAEWQAVGSWTSSQESESLIGTAYDFEIERSGRQFEYVFEYNDRSPDFRTEAGFVPRTDFRRVENSASYTFRPEGRYLLSWEPSLSTERIWDYSGDRLDWNVTPSLDFDFTGQTFFSIFFNTGGERLRPKDFSVLPEDRDFSLAARGMNVSTSYFSQVSVRANYSWGTTINFAPPDGREPVLANRTTGRLDLTLRPSTSLLVDNTYILTRLTDRATGAAIFNNHIIRSRWNWQFSRELSLRFIAQYESVLPNTDLTSLEIQKSINTDFLFTYQANAWTSLFVGYNSNLQNIELIPIDDRNRIVRTRNRFINDGRQLFIKFSYLFRL
ncbi:MAG: carbohydrate binding family 9 domain-containing protein [Blastocatellia bacterium]|nr:carbohydrate binding family 9 domain-containing protein [Blastocatellia bacterium]